jgi:hypothetical protein
MSGQSRQASLICRQGMIVCGVACTRMHVWSRDHLRSYTRLPIESVDNDDERRVLLLEHQLATLTAQNEVLRRQSAPPAQVRDVVTIA